VRPRCRRCAIRFADSFEKKDEVGGPHDTYPVPCTAVPLLSQHPHTLENRETAKKLLEEYVESVNRHGVGCAEFTCGNPRLQKYVLEEGRKTGIPVPALDGFQRAMEAATGASVGRAAEDAENFASQNHAQMARNLETVPAMSRMARQLEGYVMEEQNDGQEYPIQQARGATRTELQVLLTGGPILLFLLVWRRRHRGGSR
jgi:cobalamin biosynthesis Mg chelatase CobN